MKYIAARSNDSGPASLPVLELTRRNLEVLLAKLDDPHSVRTLIDPEHKIKVMAVENKTHYESRVSGTMFVSGKLI